MLIAAMISLLVFGALGAGAVAFFHKAEQDHHYRDVESAARRASIKLHEGRLANPIRPDPGGIDQIQVVDPAGHIRYATKTAGNVRLSTALPVADDWFRGVVECQTGHRCRLVHVIRVPVPHEHAIYYVYAAKDVPDVLLPGVLESLTAVLVLALAACSAAVTWKIVGRTLAPVEAIRADLAEISATDLSRRVPEPAGEDEIARMARTANKTLDRLEFLVKQQRQFTADASHELRTPIAGLRANIEDALMHPDDTDLEVPLEAALRDTERIEAIVTDLLLLARLDTDDTRTHKRIDLAELVTTQVRGRDTDIRTNLTPGLLVTGVPAQLTRLLNNLLDNAQRHAENVIEVELRQDAGEAKLEVADDGPGILPDQRDLVFTKFTRLDPARSRHAGGTGLGLAIARSIAVAHDGTLRVEDSQRGARFVLRLPLDEQEFPVRAPFRTQPACPAITPA
jgi:signal transduction histidine kinase